MDWDHVVLMILVDILWKFINKGLSSKRWRGKKKDYSSATKK